MDNKQNTINNKHDNVLCAAERYAHEAYALAKTLPKDELYGMTSQLRRATLSVPLNIVEGHARQSAKSESQFLRNAYGSLKEAQFILHLVRDETYLTQEQIQTAVTLGEEAGRLIWTKTKSLEIKLT